MSSDSSALQSVGEVQTDGQRQHRMDYSPTTLTRQVLVVEKYCFIDCIYLHVPLVRLPLQKVLTHCIGPVGNTWE